MSESETPKFKVGDVLHYTRVSGEGVVASVLDVYDWDQWTSTNPPWPKPRHCRFLYRMNTPHGERTVCECRLRPVAEREIVRFTDLGAGGAPVGPPVLGPTTPKPAPGDIVTLGDFHQEGLWRTREGPYVSGGRSTWVPGQRVRLCQRRPAASGPRMPGYYWTVVPVVDGAVPLRAVDVPWLLCLTGYAGTGKDTVANLLIETDPNVRRVALADAVKAMTGRLYGLPEDVGWWEKHKSDAWDATVTLRPGVVMDGESSGILAPALDATGTLRDLLIHVGTTCLRDFDPEFWLRMALKRAAELRAAGHPVVVTDARFENEIRAFKAVGATCIRLTRLGTEPKGEADLAVDRVPVELFDVIHANDGDLDTLRTWATIGFPRRGR